MTKAWLAENAKRKQAVIEVFGGCLSNESEVELRKVVRSA